MARQAHQTGGGYHSTAWLVWLVAALLPALLTKNPFYLLLAILVVGVTYARLGRGQAAGQGWQVFLRVGLVLVVVSLLFNLLFVRAGATPIFTLPELRWENSSQVRPLTVLSVGGTVTLESLVYGLSNGLGLMTILLTFATFNSLVDHYQLLRSTPRFMYQSAIVMSIAITFIPHMVVALREIREAQTLRGHRVRRIRDLLPLFVALLAEGLERSLTLAESMEARGFAGQRSGAGRARGLLFNALIALALLLLAGGAFARSYFAGETPGGLAILAGGLLLVGVLWWLGRSVQRSRYRRDLWRRQDTLLVLASAGTSLVLLATWITQRAALIFYPYPRVAWPPFTPIVGLALLLLATPALIARRAKETAYD